MRAAMIRGDNRTGSRDVSDPPGRGLAQPPRAGGGSLTSRLLNQSRIRGRQRTPSARRAARRCVRRTNVLTMWQLRSLWRVPQAMARRDTRLRIEVERLRTNAPWPLVPLFVRRSGRLRRSDQWQQMQVAVWQYMTIQLAQLTGDRIG